MSKSVVNRYAWIFIQRNLEIYKCWSNLCHCKVKLHKNARKEHKKTKIEILEPGERNDGD